MAAKHVILDDRLFLDLEREKRTLIPEVIYAFKKSNQDLLSAIKIFMEERSRVFVSRLSENQISFLSEQMSTVLLGEKVSDDMHDVFVIDLVSRCGWYDGERHDQKRSLTHGTVGLVAAGTSDLSVLREADSFLKFNFIESTIFADIGVASLGRVLYRLPEIQQSDLLIVFAGMEAALPSVLAGLTSQPIIAVPTSTGYGVSQGGFSALLTSLSSCSPGLLTVNIDNGIGAASSAIKILGIKGKKV